MRKAESDNDVKVAKLAEYDDIEAYLTIFELPMVVYEVKKNKWAFKLSPQLVGKAQQAYAGISVTDVSDYDQLIAANPSDVVSTRSLVTWHETADSPN